MECKSLRASGKDLKKFNVAYFGASCDPLEKNKEFAEKLELDYPLLSDTDSKVASAYGIQRGKRSKRVTIFVDLDGKIAYVESKVNLREHGKQIVEQLEKLSVAKMPVDAKKK